MSHATIHILSDLATALQRPARIEVLLRTVVDFGARALGTDHLSVRLIGEDEALIASVRAGQPYHQGTGARFRRGEGLIGAVAATGEPVRTGHAEEDPRYVHREGASSALQSFVGVPLRDGDEIIGVLAAVAPERDRFGDEHEAILRVISALCGPRLAMARLDRLARLDPLTGVLNRYGLRLLLRSKEIKNDLLSFVMVDLDHFKSVNDRHGHAAGDEVLRHVASTLRQAIEPNGAIARYGGEEFLLVLPDCTLDEAVQMAERVRAETSALRAPELSDVKITLSAGVAQRRHGESHAHAVNRADQALLLAKAQGRDRVVQAAL